MKNFRIITTTNDKEIYLDFWPTVAKNYENAFGFPITLGYITEKNEDDPIVNQMRKYGEVILFKPLDGVDSGVQAKASRMFLCTQYPNEYCIIVDIDMYLLKPDFVFENWFSKVDDKNLIAVGHNAYINSISKGKFPMYNTTAKGTTFQKIVNPKNLSYEELFNSWKCVNIFDEKESVSNPFNRFSDESLLRVLIHRWKDNHLVKYISRKDFNNFFTKRIDRSRWNKFDIEKMNNGFYIDCNPLRPLNKNIKKVEPILKYLRIDEKDWFVEG